MAAEVHSQSTVATRRSRRDDGDERRVSKRLPIELAVRYRVFRGKRTVTGSGTTLNMSSSGILFTTESAESALRRGERVELSVSWPALLHGRIGLNLIVVGYLVRVEGKRAAMIIHGYDFRTSGSTGP